MEWIAHNTVLAFLLLAPKIADDIDIVLATALSVYEFASLIVLTKSDDRQCAVLLLSRRERIHEELYNCNVRVLRDALRGGHLASLFCLPIWSRLKVALHGISLSFHSRLRSLGRFLGITMLLTSTVSARRISEATTCPPSGVSSCYFSRFWGAGDPTSALICWALLCTTLRPSV